jgi:hypothetical protein
MRAFSFDHLVGADQECRWERDPDCLCGLQIDHELESGRLLDREIASICA